MAAPFCAANVLQMKREVKRIKLGIERLLDEKLDLIRGKRLALVCNQASVDHSFRHAADLFHDHPGTNLTTLFGPQHGIRGNVQDNMIETEHATELLRLELPGVY